MMAKYTADGHELKIGMTIYTPDYEKGALEHVVKEIQEKKLLYMEESESGHIGTKMRLRLQGTLAHEMD